MVVQAANAAIAAVPTVQVTQVDSNTAWVTPGTWVQRAAHNFTVPAGFTTAYVTLFAAAGATFADSSGNGLIGVQPTIQTTGGTGISNGASYPAGSTQALSVTSFQALNLSGLTGGDTLSVSCWAYRNYAISGTENAHLSAQVIFYR